MCGVFLAVSGRLGAGGGDGMGGAGNRGLGEPGDGAAGGWLGVSLHVGAPAGLAWTSSK